MDNAQIQNLKQKYKCIEGNLPSVIKKAYIQRIKEVLTEFEIEESVEIRRHSTFFQKLGISLTGGIITGGIGGGVMALIDVSSVTIIGGLTGGISFAIGAVGVGIYTLYSVLSNNKIKEHFSNVKKELLDCINNTKKKFEELIIKIENKEINDFKTELSLQSGEFSKLQKEKVEVLKNEAKNLSQNTKQKQQLNCTSSNSNEASNTNNINSLNNRVSTLEAKPDKDTIYDDTLVKGSIAKINNDLSTNNNKFGEVNYPFIVNGTDNGGAKLVLDYSETMKKIVVYYNGTSVGSISVT